MVETHSPAEKLSVLLFITLTIVVSYQVSAYTRNEELELLSRALENSYNQDEAVFDSPPEEDDLPTEKRYARLSYGNYGNTNRGGRRFFSSRYYANYYKPWLNLADKECWRQRCNRDSDCCRRYSKCDNSARVCYSCWYGHPCKTSRDCCQAYPHCNRRANMCTS